MITRHAISLILAVGVALAAFGSIEGARAEDEAVKFMRKAADSLLRAQKQGTRGAFEASVRRYGHVPAIGLYALGNYRRGLDHGDRESYYRGLVRFIGRYAAAESPKYPVADVKFAPNAIRDGRSILVDSQVILADGTTYDVAGCSTRTGTATRCAMRRCSGSGSARSCSGFSKTISRRTAAGSAAS